MHINDKQTLLTTGASENVEVIGQKYHHRYSPNRLLRLQIVFVNNACTFS